MEEDDDPNVYEIAAMALAKIVTEKAKERFNVIKLLIKDNSHGPF